MRTRTALIGAALLVVGVVLVALARDAAAREEHFDPTTDRASGAVRILGDGSRPLTMPETFHRGATYKVYDRTFTLERLPPEVERVEFAVHMTLAREGSVHYPWREPGRLPVVQSYSEAHLQGSPWVPPYSDRVHVLEARHVFTSEGETWRARLRLDTEDLAPPPEPPEDGVTRYEYVLGTWYVAVLHDGTTWDRIGIAGAGEEHHLEVVEDEPVARALQAGGTLAGAVLAVGGAAVLVGGMFRRRPGARRG